MRLTLLLSFLLCAGLACTTESNTEGASNGDATADGENHSEHGHAGDDGHGHNESDGHEHDGSGDQESGDQESGEENHSDENSTSEDNESVNDNTAAGSNEKLDFTPGGPIKDEELSEFQVHMSCAIDGEDAGTMVFKFWPEKAPVTVRNFMRYASEGLYDGLTFHRIMKGFMVQGGCPLGNGTGSGKFGPIKGEFSRDEAYNHVKGVISMARTANPNSATCQIFICNARAASLDGSYASFGQLVSGEEALDKISNVPVSMSSRGEPSVPNQRVTMTSVTVVRS